MIDFNEIWDNDGFLSSCSRDDAEHFYNAGQQSKIDELKKKLDCCREENKALLRKLNVPEGYKLVPVETTAKQNREGVKKFVRHRNENTWSCDAIDDIYKAMIGAADEIN